MTVVLALIVTAIVAAPLLAIRYVGSSDPQFRIAAALLGLGVFLFGSWLIGQGDESVAAAVIATAGLIGCVVTLRRGRRNAAIARGPST